MRRDGKKKKKNRKAWIHFRTGLVVGNTWSLLLCMKTLAERERMWRDGRAERREEEGEADTSSCVFKKNIMQSYYRLIWIINRAARGTWSHTTHAQNAELLWRQNKTIQGEAGGSNMGLSPWMEGNNGTKKTRYKAATTGNRSVIWGSWAKVCFAQSIAGGSNLESVERKVSNNYTDVSSWRFYKPPDMSEVDGPQVWGDQNRIFFTGSSTIAIRDCGDQFFKPSHDVSLTLTKCFLCLNLTRVQAQRRDESDKENVTQTNVKLRHKDTSVLKYPWLLHWTFIPEIGSAASHPKTSIRVLIEASFLSCIYAFHHEMGGQLGDKIIPCV